MVLLCCGLAATAAFGGAAKVRVAFATWVGYGPLYIARDKGFFEKQGLDVELTIIDDESQYAAAMASGNIDALGNVLDREVVHYAKHTPEVVLFAHEAILLADTIHIMSRRPGRIVKSIPIAIPRPRDHRVTVLPEFTAIKKDIMEMLWAELG